MIEVAVVGLGPWGLSALERLLHGLEGQGPGGGEATVHVIDPARPGSGVYAVDQPDYFILNTPCGQHCLHPYPYESKRLGFYEWVRARGYRWVEDRCEVTSSGRPITPDDFLPRRLMGEYLEWFYDDLVAHAPRGVTVVHHGQRAVAIEPSAGRERIRLEGGATLEVDFALLATGHTDNVPAEGDAPSLPPYPEEAYSAAPPGSNVAVSGMGLVAIDVVIALTRGRGGRFAGEGQLRYVPSGREPVIHMFSRSGVPYRAKSLGMEDSVGEYLPGIFTPEALVAARLRRRQERGSAQLDFRGDVLPLFLAEMQLRYYEQSARLRRGAEAARATKLELTRAFAEGAFAEALARHSTAFGPFDPGETFFGEEPAEFLSSKDYESHVYSSMSADLAEALMRGGASPLKAAQELLRVLRETLREAVEFHGLTRESYLDFQANLRPRMNHSVSGPPAFRCQQLLALMDADVLHVGLGRSPAVEADGGLRLASRHLAEPFEQPVDLLVRGYLDDPSCDRSSSPLLQDLHRRGRLRPLQLGSTAVGSIDLSEDLHPIDVHGEPQSRLFVLGALSEGVRYFTAYIPSPRSRVRAFVDAEACVEQMLGRAR